MKNKKVVHRIPKEHYLVSKRNRIFEDKKKEASVNACRKEVDYEEVNIVWTFDTHWNKIIHGKIGKEITDRGAHWGYEVWYDNYFYASVPDDWICYSEEEANIKFFKEYLVKEIKKKSHEIKNLKKLLKGD